MTNESLTLTEALPDQVILRLTTVEEDHPIAQEYNVLFERQPEVLATPFGDRHGDAQLRGESAHGYQLHVAAAGSVTIRGVRATGRPCCFASPFQPVGPCDEEPG